MRKTFDIELTKLARDDKNIYVLVCDLGSFPCFIKEFPDRFINCGIQETGMVSIAVGLATQGKKVYLYGISGFVLYRAHEQLKLNVGYGRLPITLVNGGAGLVYHQVGRGHYPVDDISTVRTFPNFTFCMPKDITDFKKYLHQSYLAKNPYFIRLGKDNCEDIKEEDLNPTGYYGVIFTTNTCLPEVVKANRILINKGLNFKIECITDLDRMYKRKKHLSIVVVEDHIGPGGLGSFLMEERKIIDLHIHLPIVVEKTTNTHAEILSYYGLDSVSIARDILEWLEME